MFISNIDKLVFVLALIQYRINYHLLSNRIWIIMFIYGFIASFLGWEFCWSTGFIPPSQDYQTRAKLCNYTDITSSDIVHASIYAFGDGSFLQSIFSLSNKITPGLNRFNPYFCILIVVIGVFQNCVVNYLGFVPITNNLSPAPLCLDPNCSQNSPICWNNQQIWVYYPILVYLIVLKLN